MTKDLAKILGLVLVVPFILGVASVFGPLSRLPTVFEVNEDYFVILRNHELYLGFTGFLHVGLKRFRQDETLACNLCSFSRGDPLYHLDPNWRPWLPRPFATEPNRVPFGLSGGRGSRCRPVSCSKMVRRTRK